jgi:hypothetical protein
MTEEPHITHGTSLERMRGSILRLFPLWFRWLLSALVLTFVSYLFLDVTSFFGFDSGEWVTGSRWGSYFNGGHDVLFMILAMIGATYSWIRLLVMLTTALRGGNSSSNPTL